jgi:hypothetical protein
MDKKLPAWTYSGLDTYETCPKKYYHLKVVRDTVDPPSVHTEWGKRVHEALENRIKNGFDLPEGMKQWEFIAGKISRLKGKKITEMEMAIDQEYLPAPWKSAWSRGIADLVVVNGTKAAVLDYKTGKYSPSNQLKLYAAYVFAHFPEVTECETVFVWLKVKKLTREVVYRSDLDDIKALFSAKVDRLVSSFERESWPAKPSGLCAEYCPVKTCEFNGKRRR